MRIMAKMNKFSYTPDQLGALLPRRTQTSHKGTYGRVLIVGGDRCMSGAPYFSAKAAYRVGAGLVEVLTHEANRPIIQTLLPEAVMSTWSDTESETERTNILRSISRASVIAVGMGLSQSERASQILKTVLTERKCPIVIDADALNIISGDPTLLPLIGEGAVITPHPLEASRLSGISVSDLVSDPPRHAKALADRLGTVCLLKDHRTAVASPNSENVYVNMSGNSGMSTGGSGDVLDGVIAGLIAQGLAPMDAASLGAFLHGLAGDVAAERLSEYSLIASDIIDAIPVVLSSVQNKE